MKKLHFMMKAKCFEGSSDDAFSSKEFCLLSSIKAKLFNISCPFFFRATNEKAFPFLLTGCIGVRVHVTDSEGPNAGIS